MTKMDDKRTGLNAKLIRTHLSIAILGVLFLSLSFVFFSWLKQSQTVLTQVDVPIVQATANIQTNLQKSLAALRAWVTVNNPRFQTIRGSAWDDGILPNLGKLNELAKASGDKTILAIVAKIKKQLVDLKVWQWHIENIAGTPGNNPSKVIVLKQLKPEAMKMLGMAKAIIIYEQNHPSQNNERRYQLVAEFNERFLQALTELKSYVLTGSASYLDRATASLILSEKRLASIQINESTPYEFKTLIQPLKMRLNSFIKRVKQLQIYKSQRYPLISSQWLAEKSDLLAMDINNSLDKLMQIEMIKQAESTQKSPILLITLSMWSCC